MNAKLVIAALLSILVSGGASAYQTGEFFVRFGAAHVAPDDSSNGIAIPSKSGNYILSLIVDSGAWVETQTWTLVSVNTFSASIQWNRMVSNPSLTWDEPLRVFGQMGFGQLSKVSNDCNIWDALERKVTSRK
jgi:hypothetical protein